MNIFILKNLPITIVYLILGIGGFIANIFDTSLRQFGEIPAFFCILIGGAAYLFKSKKSFSKFTIIYVIYVSILIILPFFLTDDINIRAFMIEFKAFFYLLAALLWCGTIGTPDKQFIYNCAKFFSVIVLINTIFQTVRFGAYSRFYHISGECNYDAFLILIGFSLINSVQHKKTDIIWFILSILTGGSLTGIITIFALSAFWYSRKHNFLVLGYACIAAFIIFSFVVYKYGDLDTEHILNIDRVIFYQQAFISFAHLPLYQQLFGVPLGMSLSLDYVIPQFAHYIITFENINNFTGYYPFYFHAAYLRMLFSIGLPLTIMLLFYVAILFFKRKDITSRLLLLTFFLFSCTLSSMTIRYGALIFFITFITVFFEKKSINTFECSQLKVNI